MPTNVPGKGGIKSPLAGKDDDSDGRVHLGDKNWDEYDLKRFEGMLRSGRLGNFRPEQVEAIQMKLAKCAGADGELSKPQLLQAIHDISSEEFQRSHGFESQAIAGLVQRMAQGFDD